MVFVRGFESRKVVIVVRMEGVSPIRAQNHSACSREASNPQPGLIGHYPGHRVRSHPPVVLALNDAKCLRLAPKPFTKTTNFGQMSNSCIRHRLPTFDEDLNMIAIMGTIDQSCWLAGAGRFLLLLPQSEGVYRVTHYIVTKQTALAALLMGECLRTLKGCRPGHVVMQLDSLALLANCN